MASGPVWALRRVIAPLTRTRLFRRSAPRWLPPAERLVARVTGGRLQVSGILVPSLVLHSTGARSGLVRDTPLMYTADADGSAIVAGTSFGRRRHPDWTYNLLAEPYAEVSIRGRRHPVHAQLIEDDQLRERAWQIIQHQWPGYRSYEREAGRRVWLFRLQPTDGAFFGTRDG